MQHGCKAHIKLQRHGAACCTLLATFRPSDTPPVAWASWPARLLLDSAGGAAAVGWGRFVPVSDGKASAGCLAAGCALLCPLAPAVDHPPPAPPPALSGLAAVAAAVGCLADSAGKPLAVDEGAETSCASPHISCGAAAAGGALSAGLAGRLPPPLTAAAAGAAGCSDGSDAECARRGRPAPVGVAAGGVAPGSAAQMTRTLRAAGTRRCASVRQFAAACAARRRSALD